MTPLICPSILAANFNHLQADIEMINRSEADWIHCDVMDGRFVPNISFGIPIIKAVKQIASKPLDVHLMIEEPEKYFEAFHEAGANSLTIHVEATKHLDRALHQIRQMGMKAGVALNPASPVELVQHVLPFADIVLIMSVNPGFGGQAFIPYTYEKVRTLRQMIDDAESDSQIQIDGGVGLGNHQALIEAGANVLVAGSSVFKSASPIETIAALKKVN